MTGFKRYDEKQIDPKKVWSDDAFQTLEKYADFLTKAMTGNTKNFVLNVNGAWGTGKSFFVQRWATDLQKKYPVVEFNAWENDSEEDPLTSLLAVCAESLKQHFTEDQTLIEGIKKKGGRIALRLGGIATKAGLRKILGEKGVQDICNLFSEETESDLIDLGGTLVEEQIKKQQERKSFVDELKALVAKLDASNELPIFIFIDELDRCRPTFAIELLERVKHLFHVDGIKFIISTDTEQLIHSIAGVYGDRFEGHTYLQRFFDETFTLPAPNPHQFSEMLFQGFGSERSWMNNWHLIKSPAYTFGELAAQLKLTLRQQLQAHHRVMAVVNNTSIPPNSRLHFFYICLLVMLRLKHSSDYGKLMSAKIKYNVWRGISEHYSLSDSVLQLTTEYIRLMDFAPQNLIDLINREDDRRLTDEELLIRDIRISCFNAFAVFKKYPQLVELTETIS